MRKHTDRHLKQSPPQDPGQGRLPVLALAAKTSLALGLVYLLSACTGACTSGIEMMLRQAVRVDDREVIVLNPDFEELGSDGLPTGWTVNVDYQENGTASSDLGFTTSGRRSLRIDLTPQRDGEPRMFQMVQSLPVLPLEGKRIRVSARIRMADGAQSALFGLWGGFKHERVMWIPWTTVGVFKQTEFQWVVPNDPPVLLLSLGAMGNRGTVWYDDVRLTAEDSDLFLQGRPEPLTTATPGVSYTGGLKGKALAFNAPGALVRVPLAGRIRDDRGAMEMWLGRNFPDHGERELGAVMTIHGDPLHRNLKQTPLLFFLGRKKLLFSLGDRPATFVISKTLKWEKQPYHHVVLQWQDGEMELCLDGKSQGRKNIESKLPILARHITLGNSPMERSLYSELTIDEFRIYSRPMDKAELKGRSQGRMPEGLAPAVTYYNGFDGADPLLPVRMTSEHTFNMFQPGEPLRFDLTIPVGTDPGQGKARVALTFCTLEGRIVRSDREKIAGLKPDPNGTEARYPVELPAFQEKGFYPVEMTVFQGDREINRGRGYVWIEEDLPDIRPEDTPLGMVAGFKRHFSEETFAHMKAMGVKWCRFGVEWREVEPERGHFTWEALDRFVQWAEDAGISLVATLNNEEQIPDWASSSRPHGDEERNYPPKKLEQWETFVFQVVSRYQGRIRAWTPWGEPNLQPFWAPKPDAQAYLELLKVTHKALKRADPDAYLIGLDLAVFDEPYLDQVQDEAMPLSDGVAFHPYSNPHGPYEPSPVLFMFAPPAGRLWPDAIRQMKGRIEARKKGGDLWITEHGQNTDDDYLYPAEDVDPERQACYLVQFALEAVAGGVKRYFWYAYYGSGSFRVVELDYTPRPSGLAFYYLNRRLAGSRFEGVRDLGGARVFSFSRGPNRLSYACSHRGRAMESLTVAGPDVKVLDKYDRPLDCPGIRGEGCRLEVGESPVCILGVAVLKEG